ncbi:MAG TPA: alpha/beta hydrolase, partial [Verrucomicrobiaceae bacterium]
MKTLASSLVCALFLLGITRAQQGRRTAGEGVPPQEERMDEMLDKMGLTAGQKEKYKVLQREYLEKVAGLRDKPPEERRLAAQKALDEVLEKAKEQKVLTEAQVSKFKDQRTASNKPQSKTPSPGAADPAPTRGNVAYGPHELNVLDFWQAKSEKPTPVVVYMHGGSFIYGDKEKIRSRHIIPIYLEKGISFASIDYRRRKDAPLQDILRDAARAIQFMRSNAKAWNIDGPRIAMYGESAGAGTALWLAAHPDLADPDNSDPVLRESSRVAAACCVDGQATYDITQWDQLVGTFKPEWLLSPDEVVRLYYFQSEADFKTPRGRKILEDCDMLHWLSRESSPI